MKNTLAVVVAAFAEHAVSPCKPDDNFFAIGGDSLKAAMCVYSLRASGLTVTLRDMFDCKTAVELAARIDGETAT